uniref:Lipase domain-containing protein n=1 Tax=Eptatretus burgeri TaxID=7764 RepID=A0A8C4QXE4_EPTBU
MNNSFQILVQNASDVEGRGCPIDLSLDFPISELMERNGFSWKNSSDGSVMLGNCNFNIFKQSFFVIHGWSVDTWIDSLVAAIFHRHPHSNVFVLNWLDLAQVRYARAVRRGHQVARHIAAFIDWLNEQWGYLPKRIHLVGFSLGAHVAGFVGSAVSRGQIGRITGLDPAGPIFETAPPDKSLSPDDALFVDVIHTSIVGPAGLNFSMGIQRPVGHQDFYPNGGTYQPGCDWSIAYENVGKYGLAQTLKCGHERAVHIFVDTLRSKYLPPAYPCSSLEEWQRGNCLKCNKSTCPLMGKEVK